MNGRLCKCPNPQCGSPVQPDDRFCPFCGQVLLLAGPPPAAAVAADAGPESLPAELTGDGPTSRAAATRGSIERGGQGQPLLQPEPPATSAGGSASSDCPDLEVLYNNSCVFVLNMQSTFDFELRPQVDGLRDLFIEVRQSGQVIARERPLVIPKRGVPLPLSLNYTPRHTHAGKASFTILLGYRKGAQQRFFAACRTHTIYSGKEDARQVCDSLVVEIKNNIQQGHAGDLSVDQNFRELRDVLHQRTTLELDREFLQLINARPFWTPLPLAECAPEALQRDASLRPARATGPWLLQASDGSRVWLLTQPVIRLGRHRSCEVLARVLDNDGSERRMESLRISQLHACIEWRADHCLVRDGGQYPEQAWRPSSSGVWVDGQRLPPGGQSRLTPGQSYRISLGEEGPTTYALEARLYALREMPELPDVCSAPAPRSEAPACLVLRRRQGPPWVYLALRACAALAWADARCAGACVCVRGDCLQFSNGHTCEQLVAGQTIRAGAVDFRITASLSTAASQPVT